MKGGIGGGTLPGPADEFRDGLDDERRLVPRRAPVPGQVFETAAPLAAVDEQHEVSHVAMERDILALQADSQTAKARCDELQDMLLAASARLDATESQATGTEGQFAQVWQALRTMDANQQAFNARLAAVAQQVVRNNRKDALEIAARSRGPADSPAKVCATADLYTAWLNQPAAVPDSAHDEQKGDDDDGRTRSTSH